MTPEQLDLAFAVLEHTAIEGGRCPMNEQLGHGAAPALARAGRILIEVYPHNFRRVTILTGPHAGKSTAPCPHPKWRPMKVIGTETRTHLGTVDRGASQRRQPSAPRPLTREELAR